MEIVISEFSDGANRARGLAVLIDVFRATTTQAALLTRAEGPIHVFGSYEYYRSAALPFVSPLIFSELDFPAPHVDNSPTHAERAELAGRDLVSITTNGTRGLAVIPPDTEVICGAFVNADQVLAYIERRRPALVTLLAIGLHRDSGAVTAPEDMACARYLRARLLGTALDTAPLFQEIRALTLDRFAKQLGRKPYILTDVDRALTLGRYPAVPLLVRAENGLQLIAADV